MCMAEMFLFRPGTLALYHTRTAVVKAVNGDKLEIAIEGGGSKNVRAKDLEFVHAGPVQTVNISRLPDPDFDEIMALMETETLPFAEFAELLYGKATPEAAYSALMLLKDDLYFAGSIAEGIRLKSQAEIDAKLEKIRAKEAEKARHDALVARITNGTLLPEDLPFMAEIEQVAYGQNPSSRLMKDAGIEATPEKAHRLLLNLKVWDHCRNPLPMRAGIALHDPEFPEPEQNDGPARTDLTALTAYAIDDEGSNDPDDAIAWDPEQELLWVHVADPASIIPHDSEIDQEARSRGENLYLPEGITHMLPRWMTPRFGLGLHETDPAISFGIRITDDGDAELEKLLLSTVRVERHTYTSAALLDLETIREKLETFRDNRARNGALFIQLPEVKVSVDIPAGGVVSIRNIEMTPSRELVANAMLAAGSALAKWAVKQDIPMPFVTQEPAEKVDENLPELPRMYARRKACLPGSTDTVPGLHAGLGLDPYVRVTSPLRRYSDLLAHQQIHRYLAGEELLDSEAIENALFTSEAAAYARRRLERLCNEYWTLVWMNQQDAATWQTPAVPVYHPDDRWFFLMPEIAYEYRCRFGGKVVLGEPLAMQLQKADPVMLTARMRLVFPGKEVAELDGEPETDEENSGS